MLVMGSGTAWANFWSNGVDRGTWTLTNFSDFGSRQNLINTLKNNGWTPTGKDQNTWKLSDESGSQVTYFEGAGHMKVGGTVRLTIKNGDTELSGTGLALHKNASIAIECNPYYAVEITAKSTGRSIDCAWTGVRGAPESPQFTMTESTQTVLFNGTSAGWVTMTNSSNEVNAQLVITEIKMYPKPVMQWVKNGSQLTFDKLNLAELNYVEPSLEIGGISGIADVRYELINNIDNCVSVKSWSWNNSNNQLTWELYGLDKGNVTIKAIAVNNQGQELLSASYRLIVDVDQYQWVVDEIDEGNNVTSYKFRFTGEGAILNHEVDAVPYMSMVFGDPDEIGIVRPLGDTFVSTILDQSKEGDRAVALDPYTHLPISGTFYKFTPDVDGEIQFWANLLNGGNAVFIDANDPTHPKDNMGSQGNGVNDQHAVQTVQAGHTYYLFGITPEIAYLYPSASVNGFTYFNPNNYNTWTVCELNAFKFKPTGDTFFKFHGLVYDRSDKGLYEFVTVTNESTGVTTTTPTKRFDEAKQPFASGVTYKLEFYPTLATSDANVSIAGDGKLTIGDGYEGGAFAVKAYSNNKFLDYYIVTVPYETHDWWFTESIDPEVLVKERPEADLQSFADWTIDYKVLRPEYTNVTINGQTQNLRLRKEVKNPVLCSATPIKGNNAGFAIQTAGLIFNASAHRFGVNSDMDYHGLKQYNQDGTVYTIDDGNGVPIDQYIDSWDTDEGKLTRDEKIAAYAYSKTPEDCYGFPTNLVTMATGSSLIIPNLKKGQYIRIYWRRHNKQKGDLYRATGVTDLTGADMDGTGVFYAGNGTGYTEFIAKEGNATFTLQREGDATLWTDIYRITVGEVGEFLETGLSPRVGNIIYNPRPPMPQAITETNGTITYIDHTSYNYTGTGTMKAWGPRSQYNVPYESIVTDNGEATTQTIQVRGGTGGNNMSASYKVVGNVGTGTVSVSGDQVTFQGTGIAGIVCNYKSGDFIVDTDTLTMAYGTVDFQEYPHTWDFTLIGRNTTTPTMLADAYTNGTGINWFKKNTWGDPNTADESKYPIWQPAEDEENEYILNGFHKEIKGVMFANGAQLTAGYEPIEETKGLGIYLRKGVSGSYFIYSMADDSEDSFSGKDMLRYGIEDGAGYLKFADVPEGSPRRYIIRVPQVSKSAGQRVYICADGTPAVYQEPYANEGNGSNSTITTLVANTDGNNSYFVPENDGDVFIDVTGMKVFKIGVTSTFKKLNEYQGNMYATESREHNVKYDLSGYFTGDEVKAYKVTGYAKAENPNATIQDDDPANAGIPMVGNLTLEPVEVSAAETGVILVGTGTGDGFASEPLFVKDVNSDCDNITENFMVASSAGVPANPYILTRTYRLLDEKGQPTGSKKTGPLAFYKMFSGELGEHLAYFNMPAESSNYYTFRFIDEMDEEGTDADGIEQIALDEIDTMMADDAEYYNINGQKLTGKPTQKGIYICNGKKFFVK